MINDTYIAKVYDLINISVKLWRLLIAKDIEIKEIYYEFML